MHKPIILIYLLFLLITTSCSGQEFDTELTIYNKSGKVLDSLIVYDLLDKEIMYRTIKKDTVFTVKYKGKWSEIPRGERGVFTINVFDEGYFYGQTLGFIGFPTATLKDKYELYIYREYTSDTEQIISNPRPQKKKISEYNSGN